MRKLDIQSFYGWGAIVSKTRALKQDTDAASYLDVLIELQVRLQEMSESELDIVLTKQKAQAFFDRIPSLIKSVKKSTQKGIAVDVDLHSGVQGRLIELEILIQAELSQCSTYHIVMKGGYSTKALLEDGLCLYSEEIISKVPQCARDLKSVSKCVAYGTYTSAAFHLFRGLETVLRIYYEQERGPHAVPKQQTLGAYVGEMEKHSIGDEKIRASLRQLKDLHRNPIAHPEVHIDNFDEINSVIGQSNSAMHYMASALPIIN